jgi:uncharacterized protein
VAFFIYWETKPIPLSTILISIYDSLLQLAILTPFLFLAIRQNKGNALFPLSYAAAIYLLTNILLYSLSSITLFKGQQFNWTGKGAAVLFEVILAFSIPGFTAAAFGLTKPAWTGSRQIMVVCLIYFFSRLSLYYFSGAVPPAIYGEQFLFQATLPGLQEELLFRGILPGLLQKVFQQPSGTRRNLRPGWAAVITSILFGLSHGIGFREDHSLFFNAFAFLRTGFDGLLLAALAEKTKSIFPSVIYHNLLNLIGNH